MEKFELVLLRCFDPRMDRAVESYIQDLRLQKNQVAEIKIPAGIKNLASPVSDGHFRSAIIQIADAIGLSKPDVEIVLVGQTKCKGYTETFEVGREEVEFQMNELERATRIICGRYPHNSCRRILIIIDEADRGSRLEMTTIECVTV